MTAAPRSVATLVARVIIPVLALMVLLGVLGVIGVYRTNLVVNRVIDDVAPGLAANREYLQLMTDAETGVRGWVITGEQASLSPYSAALEELPRVARNLRGYQEQRPELASLMLEQERLAQRWVDRYALPRLAAQPGVAGYDARRFAEGKSVFDELREVNEAIDESLTAAGEDARHDARIAYRRAVIAMLVLTVTAALLAWFLGRRFRRGVQDPLRDLEDTVRRLADGDTSARATVGGPREVAAVAAAFNGLAEESERAQQVESETHERLLDLDQAKNDFVANVSHELRTPLTSIRGYLELLRDEQTDPAPATDRMWEIVERNVGRLGVLVEDLLTLANVESRHTTLTEVDLADVLDDVVTDLRIAAANRAITLSLELPGTMVFVLADKTQLLRAVLNVVSNAVKFCRDGGRVDVRLSTDEGEATVTVRDNGIGIPAADLAKLGSRFFRGANAVQMQIGGTGLGVRMVQVIMAKHGGWVTIDSVEDEFTLVTLGLPVRVHGAGEESRPVTR